MRLLSLIVTGALAAGLVACGGSSDGPTAQPTPVPTPTPPVPEIVAQGSGVHISADYGRWVYFTLRTVGTVTITVDYTYSDTLLGIWVAPGHCTYEMAVAQQCSWVVKSFTGGKPRKVTQSLLAGEQTLVIDNSGPHDESVSYQVVFTALSSSATQVRQAASARADETRSAPHGPSGQN